LANKGNVSVPLDISFEMTGREERQPEAFFDHSAMVERYAPEFISSDLGQAKHFFDPNLPWNGLHGGQGSSD
jgi:hypothetical protein